MHNIKYFFYILKRPILENMKKSIILIGASRGIGLALSKQLVDRGNSVIGTSRKGVVNEIQEANFSVYRLDLSNAKSIHQFALEIEKSKHKIDLLINNAGIGPDLYREIPDSITFDSTFAVNVRGIVFLTEQLIKSIRKGGQILNLSSKMGSIENCQNFDSVAYRMSKSALNMYTKILSNRLEEIEVASIHPGWVKTTIANDNKDGRLTPKESAEKIIDYIENKFEDGDFWDAESDRKIAW